MHRDTTDYHIQFREDIPASNSIRHIWNDILTESVWNPRDMTFALDDASIMMQLAKAVFTNWGAATAVMITLHTKDLHWPGPIELRHTETLFVEREAFDMYVSFRQS